MPIQLALRSLSRSSFRGFGTNQSSKDAGNQFASTLNLPKTNFPMRSVRRSEEELIKYSNLLYKWQLNERENAKNLPLFVLHDGPPYANGKLHVGHAVNKGLKDIVNRYKLMRGYKISYIPGWDCHGLPIELKALQNSKKEISMNNPIEIRNKAKELASKEIEEQSKDFQKWGIMGDWSNYYKTMENLLDPKYESNQLKAFAVMYEKGYIYRGFKPVYWSPSSLTALAESELEYVDDHVSFSIYVSFPFASFSSSAKSHLSKFTESNKELKALIWTTTPWTIPANLAISVNPHALYAVVSIQSNSTMDNPYKGTYFLVAHDRLKELHAIGVFGDPKLFNYLVEDTIEGNKLNGCEYIHPLYVDKKYTIITGEHVTMNAGTGLVHTAPGHGMEDYIACRKHGIEEIKCPVNERGEFTKEAGDIYAGKNVLVEGNKLVIEQLKEKKSLVGDKVHKYVHKYPYDWRTKKPVIIRATRQWFANLKELGNDALKCIEKVNIFPNIARSKIDSMLTGREEWCISRQRSWGVPIPVFYDTISDEPIMDSDTINHITDLFEQHGSDCWWKLTTEELLHPKYKNKAKEIKKGMDTMDVWFDSGVSWFSVLVANNIPTPADIYIEGTDQHRGWFQSSLLTSVAVTGKAPYKSIVTHGFVVDEQGKKMSKSIGNIIEPSVIIKGGKAGKQDIPSLGIDVLRMWMTFSDFTQDLQLGPSVLNSVAEMLRKIRNTLRFCLANNFDFNIKENELSYDHLNEIDKYMLHKVHELSVKITEAYESYQFYKVQQYIVQFCNTDLSSFYFEIVKDRLYTESSSSINRRSSQFALHHIAKLLTQALAPIAFETAEEIFTHYMHNLVPNRVSSSFSTVYQMGWMITEKEWQNQKLSEKYNLLKDLRSSVFKHLQLARESGKIHVNMEAFVTICVEEFSPIAEILQSVNDLSDFLVVTRASIVKVPSIEENSSEQIVVNNVKCRFSVSVSKSNQFKCPRCWKHSSVQEGEVCSKCSSVIRK